VTLSWVPSPRPGGIVELEAEPHLGRASKRGENLELALRSGVKERPDYKRALRSEELYGVGENGVADTTWDNLEEETQKFLLLLEGGGDWW